METSLDDLDNADYSDVDHAPHPEDSCSSDLDEETLCPAAKKPLPALHYPLSSPAKRDDGSESPTDIKRGSFNKRNTSTPKKRKISSNSSNKSRVDQISNSIKVLPPSNTEHCRVYNKRNYCLYCLRPVSKIARHLEAVHKNIEEVALAFQHPKHSKERRNSLNILRRRGNFAHNTRIVKKGAGELQVCYRPRKSTSGLNFIHCCHCQGLYSKKTLWKHIKRCPAKKESDNESKYGKWRVQSICALQTAVARDISEGFKSVLSCMISDEVTQLIQNDQLLLQFGQHLYDLNGSPKNRHDHIRQRLRELGRLLLVARKTKNIQRAEEFIYPANFNHLISAVKELAGYNPVKNTFTKPTLALKIGSSLGIICEFIETGNLTSEDRNWSLVRFAREFKTIKNFRWKGLITRGATTTMRESKWNAPQILPLTEDVKCLDSHMENVKATAERMLRLNPSANSYAMLAKVVLAQVIIFNRLREGEVSRMELSTFKERKQTDVNGMAVYLTPLKNKRDFVTRAEIHGKQGRGVSILLKPSMVSAMELLVETRELCGVPKENIYMFARPGALSAYRGGNCIQMLAKESGAKHPEALTSTNLRKQVAPLSQGLNLQENEADQLAKMSKTLLTAEKGTLSQYKGQTLDVIEIKPEGKSEYLIQIIQHYLNIIFNCW